MADAPASTGELPGERHRERPRDDYGRPRGPMNSSTRRTAWRRYRTDLRSRLAALMRLKPERHGALQRVTKSRNARLFPGCSEPEVTVTKSRRHPPVLPPVLRLIRCHKP